MRKNFHQYFRPTQGALRQLWDHGFFSFDASVLLNIYGYSSETRDSLVDFVQKNVDRIRLPHQFGLEYARDRSSVIIKQIKRYQKVEDTLRTIEKEITSKRDHPYLTRESLSAFLGIQKELAASRHRTEKLVGSDPYAEKLLTLFDGKVSEAPTLEQLEQLELAAKRRYDKKIPPGFSDLKDKGVESYGDYIAWHQLMQISKTEQKGIILVIDDLKEDWWLIQSDRTIGPRPELVEEFSRTTSQQFWMYTSDNFLRAAKTMAAADFTDNTIQEVSERLASQREMLRPTNLKVTLSDRTQSAEGKSDFQTLSKLLAELRERHKSQVKSTELVEETRKSDKVESDEPKEESDGRESEV